MNLENPEPCCLQNNCHNFCEAKNGNCACEFGDVLECWVELEPNEKNRCKKPSRKFQFISNQSESKQA
jgi:hypothetical protein